MSACCVTKPEQWFRTGFGCQKIVGCAGVKVWFCVGYGVQRFNIYACLYGCDLDLFDIRVTRHGRLCVLSPKAFNIYLSREKIFLVPLGYSVIFWCLRLGVTWTRNPIWWKTPWARSAKLHLSGFRNLSYAFSTK